MGTFTIITEPKEGETSGDVKFVADKKAETSGVLLDLIAEKSGKGRVLVASDLESYLEQVRQFVNIGKPYIINDVGVVSLNKYGDYVFTRNTGGAELANNNVQVEQHFLPENTSLVARMGKRNGIMGIGLIIFLLVIAGVGYGVYTMFNHKSNTDTGVTTAADTQTAAPVTPPPVMPDTTAVAKDSTGTANKPDSVAVAAIVPIVSKDSSRYKFIFETTTSGDRARTRIAQLRSFGDPASFDSSKQADGSFSYRLFLRKKIAIADSAKAKDSIQLYLSKSVTVVRE
ncbi:hypothetical protein FLA_3694 [Filimonas lacunae]|nr:hypothetical protein FLA_3694 [Filimonas lacunae]